MLPTSLSPEAIYSLSFEALVAAIQIAACVLVLRENSVASRIMLGGALMSVLARAALYVAAITGGFHFPMFAFLPVCAQAGTVIFFVGLLLHARRRRAMARRVEELEQLLSARAEA